MCYIKAIIAPAEVGALTTFTSTHTVKASPAGPALPKDLTASWEMVEIVSEGTHGVEKPGLSEA